MNGFVFLIATHVTLFKLKNALKNKACQLFHRSGIMLKLFITFQLYTW